jgi:PAS domain S-box-containing protein
MDAIRPVLPAAHEAFVLRAAVEASPVNVTIADMSQPDGPIIYANAAFYSTTGYTPDEVIGRNCRFLQGPDTDRDMVQRMREAIAARVPFTGEILNYRRDRTAFLNRLELAPLVDRDAGLDAYVGIQRDITAFRAAETCRREREKLAALGRLSAGFSHELNNLLQPIVTYADLLAARLATGDEEASEQLRVILDSARAARNVTAQVLRFARVRAATGLTAPAGRLLGDAMRLAARLLPPDVKFTVSGIDDLLEECELDATELLQVFSNLLKNAADAMCGQGLIRIEGRAEAGSLIVTVADNGPGMPPETAARIFEPFFSTKAAGSGTGLGLSTVWGIVTGWGGSISVDTAPGRGARFTLVIPLKPTPDLERTI